MAVTTSPGSRPAAAAGALGADRADPDPAPAQLVLAVQAGNPKAGDAASDRRAHHEVAHHPFDQLPGGGEVQADVAVRLAGEDRQQHADQPALGIDQRPARHARVDRGVGLDEVLDWVEAHAGPIPGGDHAAADREAAAEGIAQGADRCAERGRRRRLKDRQLGLDLQERQVRRRVTADKAGLQLRPFAAHDPDLSRALDDVQSGDQVAAGRDGHRRALGLLPTGRRTRLGPNRPEGDHGVQGIFLKGPERRRGDEQGQKDESNKAAHQAPSSSPPTPPPSGPSSVGML